MASDTDLDRAWELIDTISICMLTSNDAGRLRSRPMASHALRDENAIRFLTDARHHEEGQIDASPDVCLAFADTHGQKYVSVTGEARISNDRAMIDRLWSTPAKAWWQSKDDPNIRVLTVTPREAEYWDAPGALVSTVKMVAAAATGSRPDMGENRKLAM
jgi:general stress protein 26